MKFMIPKLFLWRYPLKFGSIIAAIFMSCVMVAWCIAAVIHVAMIAKCDKCSDYAWRNSYSLSIIACLYCFIILGVNLWLIWGIKREKPSVIVCWVVVTAIFLIQSAALLAVLLCLYSEEGHTIAWLVAVVAAVAFYCILLYFFFVVCGYWVELKAKSESATE